MNNRFFIIAGVLILSIASCKGKTQKHKEQIIANRIVEMKTEANSSRRAQKETMVTEEKTAHQQASFVEKIKRKITHQSPGDSIIGLWEVNNNYYMAIYEIIKYDKQYFGKIHYYNDGETEITSQNSKEDYFLGGIFYEEGSFTDGKMYMPDGTYHRVNFQLKGDTLNAQMTIDGHPYSEIWSRKKYE